MKAWKVLYFLSSLPSSCLLTFMHYNCRILKSINSDNFEILEKYYPSFKLYSYLIFYYGIKKYFVWQLIQLQSCAKKYRKIGLYVSIIVSKLKIQNSWSFHTFMKVSTSTEYKKQKKGDRFDKSLETLWILDFQFWNNNTKFRKSLQ